MEGEVKDAIAFSLGALLASGIVLELFVAQGLGCPSWLIATLVTIEYLAVGVALGWMGSNPFWGTYMGAGFGLATFTIQIMKLMPDIVPRLKELEFAAISGGGLMGICFLAFAARHVYDRLHGRTPRNNYGPLAR